MTFLLCFFIRLLPKLNCSESHVSQTISSAKIKCVFPIIGSVMELKTVLMDLMNETALLNNL